jgi:Domain of unknown function (DUF4476)
MEEQIMKSIFTFLISTVVSISSFAYYGEGTLSVTYLGKDDIRVTVNEARYQNNDHEILIENLRPGYHAVTVYKEKNKRKKNWWGFGNGGGIFGNKYEVLYTSSVYVKPGYFVDIVINRFGKALVDEKPMNRNGRWDDDDNGWDNDRDRDRDRDNGGWGNGGNNGSYGRPMSERDFEKAKETVRREVFDNTRLDIAKHIVNQNMMTTMQVKELVQMFSFDESKLDLAKYAYRNTTDRGSYYLIYDAFSFSKSKEELARYIREFR